MRRCRTAKASGNPRLLETVDDKDNWPQWRRMFPLELEDRLEMQVACELESPNTEETDDGTGQLFITRYFVCFTCTQYKCTRRICLNLPITEMHVQEDQVCCFVSLSLPLL
eukprot:SAG25_NODE_420_length_8232_cov_3.178901_10_plen_111_part_00